jgi:AhpD family alkylhydroperoxidase
LRASVLNGCAYCIDMHTKDARNAGESEQRLYAVAAWQEAPFFSERERAALALTDALTLIADTHAPAAVYDEATRQTVGECEPWLMGRPLEGVSAIAIDRAQQ